MSFHTKLAWARNSIIIHCNGIWFTAKIIYTVDDTFHFTLKSGKDSVTRLGNNKGATMRLKPSAFIWKVSPSKYESRVKTISERLRVVEKLSRFEITEFFHSPTQCVKKAVNVKIRKFFNCPESFLYCLYSRTSGDIKLKATF